MFAVLPTSETDDFKQVTGSWDISEQVAEAGYETYLVEERDFDYSDPAVFAAAEKIKSETTDAFDAVKATATFVVDTIRYSSKVSVAYCYEETASSALEVGFSDCVGMARLVTALLRAQGVPARTMGGCLSMRQRCSALFVVSPLLEARVTDMHAGDFKKRGFLHEWVEVWTPERGWLIVEATSGQIFPKDCGAYIEYGYDSNRFDRCVINSPTFWNQCAGA